MHRLENGTLEHFKEMYIDIDDEGKLKRHYFNWLPKLSILWHFPSGDGNIYGSFSKGYKAGGFNTQMFSDVLQQRLIACASHSRRHTRSIGFNRVIA